MEMIVLKTYIGFSVLTFFVVLMQAYILTKQIKRKHPDIIQGFSKNNKSGILEKLFEYIRILIICFVPIVNISLFIVVLFKAEDFEDRVLQRIRENIKVDK